MSKRKQRAPEFKAKVALEAPLAFRSEPYSDGLHGLVTAEAETPRTGSPCRFTIHSVPNGSCPRVRRPPAGQHARSGWLTISKINVPVDRRFISHK